jgi:hypothetical protein
MYWFREDTLISAVKLTAYLVLLAGGGWLIARNWFTLHLRERWFAGFAIGIVSNVFLANLLGHFLGAEFAFWLAALLVFGIGAYASLRSKRKIQTDLSRDVVIQIIVFFLLVGVITLIGRGLGIFDDRKNLSIISTIAAGDIPPHFYMN